MSDIETIEIQYLHRELLLRMWIQNLILILLMLVFPGAVFLAASLGQHEEVVALGYVGASGMGALYWIHNAARTVQIKTYLLEWEARYQGFTGWETWLKDNRIPGLLGAAVDHFDKGCLRRVPARDDSDRRHAHTPIGHRLFELQPGGDRDDSDVIFLTTTAHAEKMTLLSV